MIYIKDEPSHIGSKEELLRFGAETGVKVYTEGIYNRDKNKLKYSNKQMSLIITNALLKFAPDVETSFINISKTFIDNYETFNNIFIKYQILSIGDKAYMGKGLVIGLTSDYFLRGKICADYTRKILEDGIPPQKLPMDMLPQFEIEYDINAARNIRAFNPSAEFLLNAFGINPIKK